MIPVPSDFVLCCQRTPKSWLCVLMQWKLTIMKRNLQLLLYSDELCLTLSRLRGQASESDRPSRHAFLQDFV